MTAPPSIPPGAMPVAWQFAPAKVLVRLPDGSSRQETQLVLALTRPSGTDYYFFPLDAAKQFAAQMDQQAGLASSGIVLPNASDLGALGLPPNGKPPGG